MAVGLWGSFILLGSPREGITGPVGRGMHCCSKFAFAEVATSDLDIPIVRQLPAANLPLGDEFEPGAVQMVGFEAPFWRGGLWKQDLEHAAGNTYDSLILADADAELDSVPVGVPPGVGRKSEKHRPPAVFR
jgi:hypothetical protein